MHPAALANRTRRSGMATHLHTYKGVVRHLQREKDTFRRNGEHKHSNEQLHRAATAKSPEGGAGVMWLHREHRICAAPCSAPA